VKPITSKSPRAAIEDLQRRLAALGYPLGAKGIDGVLGPETLEALHSFQQASSLPIKDSVDDKCWAALVDASFSLGDRTLYLRLPYFHGNDVLVLQTALNCLGFICGQADGIFGAGTERALREFQANVGIDPDGVAGSLTFQAVKRLSHAWKGKDPSVHSEPKSGFARASSVLETAKVCILGVGESNRQIAARIVNLALATNPDAKLTLLEEPGNLPQDASMLVSLMPGDSTRTRGVPFVLFSDGARLANRLDTASGSVPTGGVVNIAMGIPRSCFVDPANPTPREMQHVAVTVLDALCTYLAG